MTINVGNIDRAVRAVLGLLLLGYPLVVGGLPLGTWGILAVVIGLVLVGTAAFRFCPAYRLLGMNTCGLR